MNTQKLKSIARATTIAIFFMAMFLNVKMTLNDPFFVIDNELLAQSSSSSSSACTSLPISQCPGGSCSYQNNFGGEPKDCCTSCCPTGKSPRCNSSGCECL